MCALARACVCVRERMCVRVRMYVCLFVVCVCVRARVCVCVILVLVFVVCVRFSCIFAVLVSVFQGMGGEGGEGEHFSVRLFIFKVFVD